MRTHYVTLSGFLSLMLLGTAGFANAQTMPSPKSKVGLYTCGTPADNTLEPDSDTHAFCDIYARQFEYIKKRNELRDLIDERREKYAQFQREAVRKHKEALAEYHASLGDTGSEKTKDSDDDNAPKSMSEPPPSGFTY